MKLKLRMNNTYTINDAIMDTMGQYPYLNKKELYYSLNYVIQSEIIPEVLMKINLPKTFSRLEYKKMEFRERRRGTFKINGLLNNKYKSDDLVNNFRYIKYQLSRYNFDNIRRSDLDYTDKNSFFNYYNLKDCNFLIDKSNEKYYSESIKKIIDDDPEYKDFKKKNIQFHLSYDDKINDKIINEKYFMDFIIIIEKSLRNSYYISEIKDTSIEDIYDYEINDWEKIIVNLNPLTDDVDENIIVWDQIQSEIRLKIKNKLHELKGNKKIFFMNYYNKINFHMIL